jgi:TonB family protein
MSDLALDRTIYLPEPFVEWYRERAFQFTFAASLIVHALLIALVPAMRTVSIEPPLTLNVELAVPRPEPAKAEVREEKLAPPPLLAPRLTPPVEREPQRDEPVRPEQAKVIPRVDPLPERIKQPELVQPEAPRVLTDPRPAPRAEIARVEPRIEPRLVQKEEPNLDVRPDVRPEPTPRVILRPDARVEPSLSPRLEPKPVPRVEPSVVEPLVEPRIDARPEPRAEIAPTVVSPVQIANAPAPVVAPPVQSPVNTRPHVEAPVVSAAKASVAPTPKLSDSATLLRDETLLVSYTQDIKRKVDELKRYPKRALEAGWQGITRVRVHLAADGSVLDVAVEEKSEHSVLDEAALKMVKSLKPFPPLPDALRGKEHTIIVPIQFRIINS